MSPVSHISNSYENTALSKTKLVLKDDTYDQDLMQVKMKNIARVIYVLHNEKTKRKLVPQSHWTLYRKQEIKNLSNHLPQL